MPPVRAFNHTLAINCNNPPGIERTHSRLNIPTQLLKLLDMHQKLTAYMVLCIFVQQRCF